MGNIIYHRWNTELPHSSIQLRDFHTRLTKNGLYLPLYPFYYFVVVFPYPKPYSGCPALYGLFPFIAG